MNSLISLLKDARSLITPRLKWAQGEAAKDSNGAVAAVLSPTAVSFCALGAIRRVDGNDPDRCSYAADALSETLVSMGNERWVGRYNDTHTHEEVLQLFDTTIERLKKEHPAMNSKAVNTDALVASLRELRDTGDVSDWRAMEAALDKAIEALAAQAPAADSEAVTCSKCGVRQPLQHSPDCGRPPAAATCDDDSCIVSW